MAAPDDELTRQFLAAFDAEPELAALTSAARRVLAAAAALFYRQGSSATSVRQLTSAAGLSPGALYNHFGSRDEMLFALVQTGHLRAQRDLDAALTGGSETATDALRRFTVAYVQIHLRFPPFAQLIHREYVHLSEKHRQEIVRRRRRMRDQLVTVLQDGEQSGEFQLIGGGVGTAMMILDMCSRTSEWFNPSQSSRGIEERYAEAVLRLVGVPAIPG